MGLNVRDNCRFLREKTWILYIFVTENESYSSTNRHTETFPLYIYRKIFFKHSFLVLFRYCYYCCTKSCLQLAANIESLFHYLLFPILLHFPSIFIFMFECMLCIYLRVCSTFLFFFCLVELLGDVLCFSSLIVAVRRRHHLATLPRRRGVNFNLSMRRGNKTHCKVKKNLNNSHFVHLILN